MDENIILVEKEILENSPSKKKGIDKNIEIQLRIYGTQLIQESGILLKKKALTILTSQSIFHRFYFKKSLSEYDVKIIAITSFYLATKLEEDITSLYKIINVFLFLIKYEETKNKYNINKFNLKHTNINIKSKEYEQLKLKIYSNELLILKEIGFSAYNLNKHAHLFVLPYIHILFKDIKTIDFNLIKKLAQYSWAFLNDSMKTTLCCEYQPKCIAISSIYLSAYKLNIPLNKNSNFFKLFNVNYEDVKKICIRILELYKIGYCSYINVTK